MFGYMKSMACTNYKALENGVGIPSMRKQDGKQVNCKDCVYFSSRNCGKDVIDQVNAII